MAFDIGEECCNLTYVTAVNFAAFEEGSADALVVVLASFSAVETASQFGGTHTLVAIRRK